MERIDRQSLVKRLQKLETTLSASMGLLEGLKMGLQHNLDTQVANILALTRTFGRPGVLPRDTRPELETGLEVIEAMHATVEQALVVVTMSSSREGRR